MNITVDNNFDDAKEFLNEFIDQVIEQLLEDGEVSSDVNNDYDGGDSYFHDSFVGNKSYSLSEAAAVLEEYDDYEETDSGLWEGLAPREAVEAQAVYTYSNAVRGAITEIVDEINSSDEVTKILDKIEEIKSEEGEYGTHQEELQTVVEGIIEETAKR